MKDREKERLELVAENSLYDKGANAVGIRYCFRVLHRHLIDGNILEMGPAEGLMTEFLNHTSRQITCVEGSKKFCDLLVKKFPSIEVINALFEDYKPAEKYRNIVMGHVLEHVEDPVSILKMVKEWLSPGGIVFAAVPNARSLHRQAGVVMGLLDAENALNNMDRHHGHRRVFDPESFRQVFLKSDFCIEFFGGYWLKPVSMRQIEENWSDSMLEAFMILGERYPDIAGEIYIIASAKLSDS